MGSGRGIRNVTSLGNEGMGCTDLSVKLFRFHYNAILETEEILLPSAMFWRPNLVLPTETESIFMEARRIVCFTILDVAKYPYRTASVYRDVQLLFCEKLMAKKTTLPGSWFS